MFCIESLEEEEEETEQRTSPHKKTLLSPDPPAPHPRDNPRETPWTTPRDRSTPSSSWVSSPGGEGGSLDVGELEWGQGEDRSLGKRYQVLKTGVDLGRDRSADSEDTLVPAYLPS